MNTKAMTLAPGIQKPSDDWTAELIKYEDEYVFLAEVSNSEALEPQNIKEVKARPDWNLWEEAMEEELMDIERGQNLGGCGYAEGCQCGRIKVDLLS